MSRRRYDCFLSYNSQNREDAEILAGRLTQSGLKPFFDKSDLVAGEPWQEALEEALSRSRTCVVLIGQAGISSWQNEEIRVALERRVGDRNFRVIPVLLPGASPSNNLPRFLSRLQWIEFNSSLEKRPFDQLLSEIGSKRGRSRTESSTPYRSMAQPLVEMLVTRDVLIQVENALCESTPSQGSSAASYIALVGAGGFGKTSLAQMICHSSRVQLVYPDGVLWATIGQDSDPSVRRTRLREIVRFLIEGEPIAFETIEQEASYLRRLLDGRRVLIVVDDVWKPEDVEMFIGLGPGSGLLITTRDRRAVPSDVRLIEIGPMAEDEAETLLARGVPVTDSLELGSLAMKLGRWPLLLALVNRQIREFLREGYSIKDASNFINESLRLGGLTAFDFDLRDVENRGLAVELTIDLSLKRLTKPELTRYAQLAIFPSDEGIPLRVLERLWGLSSYGVQKLCSRLYSHLSLLSSFDRSGEKIGLHDVLHDYLRQRYALDVPRFHQHLLDVYRPPSGRWAELPKSEDYMWHHLSDHMFGAGHMAEFREQLLDFNYLQTKAEATIVYYLLEDLACFPTDPEIMLLYQALKHGWNRGVFGWQELAAQLLVELLGTEELGVKRVLEAAKEWRGTVWFRAKFGRKSASPRKPSQFGWIIPASLIFLDGQRLIIGGFDGSLHIGDVEQGKIIHTIAGNHDPITALLLLDETRIVSGAYHGGIQVWDLESGKLLRDFEDREMWVKMLSRVSDRTVVAHSFSGAIQVWDIEEGRIFRKIGTVPALSAIAFNQQWIVAGCIDNRLRLYDIGTGELMSTFDLGGAAWALTQLNEREFCLASTDGPLSIYDVSRERFELVRPFSKGAGGVEAMVVLDNHWLICGRRNYGLDLWDIRSDECLAFILLGGVEKIAVWPDSKLVATSGGSLQVFDVVGLR
jgi:hypothetical protein